MNRFGGQTDRHRAVIGNSLLGKSLIDQRTCIGNLNHCGNRIGRLYTLIVSISWSWMTLRSRGIDKCARRWGCQGTSHITSSKILIHSQHTDVTETRLYPWYSCELVLSLVIWNIFRISLVPHLWDKSSMLVNVWEEEYYKQNSWYILIAWERYSACLWNYILDFKSLASEKTRRGKGGVRFFLIKNGIALAI